MPNKKEYTPEEIREYNERKQAEIDEMIQRIDDGVNAVFESEKYKEYLIALHKNILRVCLVSLHYPKKVV